MSTAPRPHPTVILADLVGLALIGALLVGVHVLVPGPLQEEFAFRHTLSEPLSLVTSTYLHTDDGHLLSNLVGYAVAASYAYALCLWSGERRWFWLTTLTFLTILPVVVGLASLFAWNRLAPGVALPASRGFSGVAAGYGGFLAVALLVALRTRYSRRTVLNVALLVVLVLLLELLVIYADSVPIAGLGVGLVGIGLALEEIVRHGVPDGVPDDRNEWFQFVGILFGVLLVLGVLTMLVYSLFPVRVVEGNTITNVVAHLLGILFGAVISGWGYRYWGRSKTRRIDR